MSYVASITMTGPRGAEHRVEWSSNLPAAALQCALHCAFERSRFDPEQVKRLTAMDALDLINAVTRSGSLCYSVQPPGGYLFKIERAG
jgi:hypothetical protein